MTGKKPLVVVSMLERIKGIAQVNTGTLAWHQSQGKL